MTSHTTEELSGPEGDGPRRRRGPYAKSAATRQRILDVAREVFASVGYNRTSLRTIAERVGMTVPGVLHHFGGKDQMLIAVLEQRDEEDRLFFQSLVEQTDVSPADALMRVARRQLESAGMQRLLTILSAEALDPEHPAHAFFRDRNAALVSEGEALVRAILTRAGVAARVDVGAMVVTVLALFEGLSLQSVRDPDLDIESVVKIFVESTRWLSAGPDRGQPA